MNVYEISYHAALDGKYGRRAMHGDPFGKYFDELGARVFRSYGDPALQIGADHLQNVVNLIYSGRKHGIDEVVICLDHEQARSELLEHSCAVAFLPEVVAQFEFEREPPRLRATFREGIHTPGYQTQVPGDSPIEDQLARMSEQEIDAIIDEAYAGVERKAAATESHLQPKESFSALSAAVRAGTVRETTLPRWVVEKYVLTGDDARPGKKLADSIAGLAGIFGWRR
jgi:hypothetical protein